MKFKDANFVHTLQYNTLFTTRSRVHEHTISLSFLGIILRVLRLEVSLYKQCIRYKPVSNHFCSWGWGGGGVKSAIVEVVIGNRLFSQLRPRILPLYKIAFTSMNILSVILVDMQCMRPPEGGCV